MELDELKNWPKRMKLNSNSKKTHVKIRRKRRRGSDLDNNEEIIVQEKQMEYDRFNNSYWTVFKFDQNVTENTSKMRTNVAVI